MSYRTSINLMMSVVFIGLVTAAGCSDEADADGSSCPGSTTSSGSGSGGSGGGTGSGTGSGGAASEYEQYCQGAYELTEKCEGSVPSNYITECKEKQACYENLFREEALPALHTCLNERDCSTGDDECFHKIAEAQSDTPVSAAYVKTCANKWIECKQAEGVESFDGEWCITRTLIKDVNLEEWNSCFNEACSEIGECLDTHYEEAFILCGGD